MFQNKVENKKHFFANFECKCSKYETVREHCYPRQTPSLHHPPTALRHTPGMWVYSVVYQEAGGVCRVPLLTADAHALHVLTQEGIFELCKQIKSRNE
jgi:hypothetical protein